MKMVKVEGTLEKKNTKNYDDYKKRELTKTLILVPYAAEMFI